jgi:hypothetical protein
MSAVAETTGEGESGMTGAAAVMEDPYASEGSAVRLGALALSTRGC